MCCYSFNFKFCKAFFPILNSIILLNNTNKNYIKKKKTATKNTLTWWDVYSVLLDLGDIDVNTDFAFVNVNFNIAQAICKVAEDKKSIGVPGSEKETDWKQILAWATRNLKVTGGIEKDRHCMWLHTWKT